MKILFGSIVTSGRGKIGGQFIKRMPNGHSLNNLPRTKSKQSLLTKPMVSVLSVIFAEWSRMLETTRETWRENALTYPVIDKFGNPKYLSGRQLFIKCCAQGYSQYGVDITPVGFSSAVPTVTMEAGYIDVAAGQVNFDYELLTTAASVFMRLNKLSNLSVQPRYINSKILSSFNLPADGNINVYPLLYEYYPNIALGDVFQVSFTPYNNFGILGVPLVFVFQLV